MGRKIILIAIFSAILIGGVVLAGLYWQNYQSAKTNTNSIQTQTTVQEDYTKDWITYTHPKFNFSFLYPKECELRTGDDNPLSDEKTYFGFVCEHGLLDSVEGMIYSSLQKDYIAARLADPESQKLKEYLQPTGEKIVQLYTTQSNKINKILLTFISKDNSDITLEIYGPKRDAPSEEKNIYDTFINTFKLQ